MGKKTIVKNSTGQEPSSDKTLCMAEEKLRYILDTMKDAYFETDAHGDFTYVNRPFCEILGFSRDDLLFKNFRVISTPEYLDRLAKTYKEMISDPLVPEDILADVICKSGEHRPMEFSVSVIQGPSGETSGFRGIGRDVTEKIEAARSIRDSEARYKLLADNLTDVIWVLDENMQYVYISPSVKKLRGYTPDEVIKQSLEQTLTPDSYKHAVQIFSREYLQEQSGIKHGKDWFTNLELEMYRKDGSTVWTEVNLNVLYDKDEYAIGILGVTRDITERKRAEEELKKSEELYRTIFEQTATANMILAEDTTVLMVNSNFEKLMGYSRQEVENKMSWMKFVAEDEVETLLTRHRLRRIHPDSVSSTYEFKAITRSGEIRDLFMSVAMIPDTKNSIASLIDITTRKETETALRQSEERFRDLARLLPQTVFEADLNGRLTFVNESSYERFGFSREDVEAGLNVLDVMAPEDHLRIMKNYQSIIQGEKLGLNEYLARKKNGATFPVLIHTTCIYHHEHPAGLRGFLIDISEKKAMEDQLLHAQKMEAIGILAGGIAHDFNNLLMGVLGNISLMLMQVENTHPFHKRLKIMEEYIQKGSDLTRQLLGFARGGKYEVRTTNLAEFVLKSSEMFGRTRKEITIHHNAAPDLWHVDIDRGQLDQVLLNLFVNAWQAMPGGGDIFIALENKELSDAGVQTFDVKPGRFVKLTVTDTGIGMDEDTKSHIFEPFFSTKERGRGTGMGLASVYGIIKNHGGFVGVESQKGAGASFMIYLPASDRKLENVQVEDHPLRQGEETILIIDDEEMILDIASQMLENLGYKVLTAGDGKQGLAVFEINREIINLVILDMIMPIFSGKETFEALQRRDPSVKVLLSSGYSLDSQAKDIIACGCKGFIQKPFTIAVLSQKIREILEK